MMVNMKEAPILVILDCDGVLVDSEIIATRVEVRELRNLGCVLSTQEYLETALGRIEEDVVWQEIAEKEAEISDRQLAALEKIEATNRKAEEVLQEAQVLANQTAKRNNRSNLYSGYYPLYRYYTRSYYKKWRHHKKNGRYHKSPHAELRRKRHFKNRPLSVRYGGHYRKHRSKNYHSRHSLKKSNNFKHRSRFNNRRNRNGHRFTGSSTLSLRFRSR